MDQINWQRWWLKKWLSQRSGDEKQSMTSTLQPHNSIHSRRSLIAAAMGAAFTPTILMGCSPKSVDFNSIDLTGAAYAKDFRLKDHLGNIRTMADFREKIVVLFFGFTQCPDVCPTSMSTMAEVKRLLGQQGSLLQVIFVTIDPERDTLTLLKEYMLNFDPTFLALRPEPDQLLELSDNFKMYYKKVDGKSPTSYSMDHSAGKYIFDTKGSIRLFSKYGAEPQAIAQDIQNLL